MVRKPIVCIVAMVAIIGLVVAGCPDEPPPQPPTVTLWDSDAHGEVTFTELEWMAPIDDAPDLYWGIAEAEFAFAEGAGDWLLDDHGGGWINMVVDTTADGGDYGWAIQNLYVTYDDLNHLLDSGFSVQFLLGLDIKASIGQLEAAVFLSSEPLAEQPEADELIVYTVTSRGFTAAGRIGPSSTPCVDDKGKEVELEHGESVGAGINEGTTVRYEFAGIDEECCGCAPASAARSIEYLGWMHDFEREDTQQIYEDLVQAMKTKLCPPYSAGTPPPTPCNPGPSDGTADKDMIEGKNSYCKNLPIESWIEYRDTYGGDPTGAYSKKKPWKELILEVTRKLAAGCDIEVLIDWCTSGGHVAMVSGVNPWGADGFAAITYLDAEQQGNGETTWEEKKISVDKKGFFGHGWVDGFMIQCVEPAVTFIDHTFELIIRVIIEKPEGLIYPSDLLPVRYLDASESNITDLTGLEHCTNLEHLYLGGNQISDISALASLANLEVLYMPANQISDIQPLVSLTNLRIVYLAGNQIGESCWLLDNPGLGEGDTVDLPCNPLGAASLECMAELEERGVAVNHHLDCDNVAGWDARELNGVKASYSPAETISGTLDYQIRNGTDCPSCIQQILVGVIDIAGNKVAVGNCVYHGIPAVSPNWTTGNDASFSVTLPSTLASGTYYLIAVNDFQYGCSDAQDRFPVQVKRKALMAFTMAFTVG